MYRSTLRNIQLIGIAKTQDLKRHGIDKMLLPFTQELNELAKVWTESYINCSHIPVLLVKFKPSNKKLQSALVQNKTYGAFSK